MNGIELTRELMTNPLKMQELELQNLLIKEQKNKWKTTLISFILGIITALGTVSLSNKLSETVKPLNGELLLNTVNKQAEIIHILTIENTSLKLNLKKSEVSSEK
jgi:hypothetical protein